MKRLYGIALFGVIIGLALSGCGSMCGPTKVVEEAQYTPPPVQAPQRPPAVVQPAPPPKKDRN